MELYLTGKSMQSFVILSKDCWRSKNFFVVLIAQPMPMFPKYKTYQNQLSIVLYKFFLFSNLSIFSFDSSCGGVTDMVGISSIEDHCWMYVVRSSWMVGSKSIWEISEGTFYMCHEKAFGNVSMGIGIVAISMGSNVVGYMEV